MKRLVSNTKFQSPEGLIYIGPVSDYDSYAFGYGHQIDDYSAEYKEAVTEIVNNMKKERNKKGVPLRNYTNDTSRLIKDLIDPNNYTVYPKELLEHADVFNGEYYIDYPDLYRVIEDYGASNSVDNYSKLVKSSPYYISEDSEGQLNLIPNTVVFDLLNQKCSHLGYVDHNIKFRNDITRESFTFYPVDKASALEMQKTISQLAWAQDITDYIESQAGVLWSE